MTRTDAFFVGANIFAAIYDAGLSILSYHAGDTARSLLLFVVGACCAGLASKYIICDSDCGKQSAVSNDLGKRSPRIG